MKILVFSDSHGAEKNIVKAVKDNPGAEAIIFLGDGERDLEYALAELGIYPYGNIFKDVYHVRGNCDLYSDAPDKIIAELDGIRFFITHGFVQKVKRGTEMLALCAAENKCAAALFGHTHEKHHSSACGVELFNPGALRNGSYGLIEIKGGSISFVLKDVSDTFS